MADLDEPKIRRMLGAMDYRTNDYAHSTSLHMAHHCFTFTFPIVQFPIPGRVCRNVSLYRGPLPQRGLHCVSLDAYLDPSHYTFQTKC